VERFDGAPSTLVQELTALGEQRFLGRLMSLCMFESVFDVTRGRLFVNELAPLQLAEQMINSVWQLLDDLADQGKRKLHSD